jgi:hypothetical protein
MPTTDSTPSNDCHSPAPQPADRSVYKRAYREANKDKIKAYRAKHAAKERERRRRQNMAKKYGLTPEGFANMLAVQENRCAACGTPFILTKPCVDHCHKTGKVRGLLCGSCNSAAGMLGDHPGLLRRLLAYLEKHS